MESIDVKSAIASYFRTVHRPSGEAICRASYLQDA